MRRYKSIPLTRGKFGIAWTIDPLNSKNIFIRKCSQETRTFVNWLFFHLYFRVRFVYSFIFWACIAFNVCARAFEHKTSTVWFTLTQFNAKIECVSVCVYASVCKHWIYACEKNTILVRASACACACACVRVCIEQLQSNARIRFSTHQHLFRSDDMPLK